MLVLNGWSIWFLTACFQRKLSISYATWTTLDTQGISWGNIDSFCMIEHNPAGWQRGRWACTGQIFLPLLDFEILNHRFLGHYELGLNFHLLVRWEAVANLQPLLWGIDGLGCIRCTRRLWRFMSLICQVSTFMRRYQAQNRCVWVRCW